MELPAWVQKEESYIAKSKERDLFLSRSLLGVMSALSALRLQAVRRQHAKGTAALAIAAVFGFILAVSAARSPWALWAALALELPFLAWQKPPVIRRVLGMSLFAAAVAEFVVLPSLLLGQLQVLVILPCKTFLTVTAIRLLTEIFSWHELIAALRLFRVPRLLIFLLDTTLRSIVLLGDIAQEMLLALRLRSVGTNPQKLSSVGGILGVLFLKSRKMSEEMEQAMRCRGW